MRVISNYIVSVALRMKNKKLEIATNVHITGTGIACSGRGQKNTGTSYELACHGNGYRRSRTQQIRISQFDKHMGTTAHLLVTCTGTTDHAVNVISVGHRVINIRLESGWSMVLNFCHRNSAQKMEWAISWGRGVSYGILRGYILLMFLYL